jgi:hypothetical protein
MPAPGGLPCDHRTKIVCLRIALHNLTFVNVLASFGRFLPEDCGACRCTKLFGNLLAFVYYCFDRIVIHGYLSALSWPEQVVHFFRQVLGIPVVARKS